MSFSEAIKHVTDHLEDYEGRSGRSEYWHAVIAGLFALAVGTLVSWFVCRYLFHTPLNLVRAILCCTTLLLLAFSYLLAGVATRRLHDVGKSGTHIVVASVINWGLYISIAGFMLDALDPGLNSALLSAFMLLFPAALIDDLYLLLLCLKDSGPDNQYGHSPKVLHLSDLKKAGRYFGK